MKAWSNPSMIVHITWLASLLKPRFILLMAEDQVIRRGQWLVPFTPVNLPLAPIAAGNKNTELSSESDLYDT